MNFDIKSLFKKRSVYDYALYGVIILAGIILDQITKLLAVKYLIPVGSVSLIKIGDVQVLNLTYVENTGAAFGMLKDAPWVFNTISVVAIVLMLAYLFLGHAATKLEAVGLAMLVSGGIGNMIDRTVLGYVVDFIDFRLINFAVFNGADSFVCVGAGILMLALVLQLIAEQKATKAALARTTDGDIITEEQAESDNDSSKEQE